MEVVEKDGIEYVVCSCCGGELDGNWDCPNYCEADPCPCPVAEKRRANA
jgi:hypothetical protein